MTRTFKISIVVFLFFLTAAPFNTARILFASENFRHSSRDVLPGIRLSKEISSPDAVQTDKMKKNLLGLWDVETEGRQYHFFFKFYMEEDQLKGLYEGTTGVYTMENLDIEEDTVYFSVEIKASPHNLMLDFEATIDEDSLYGFLSLEHGISAIMGSKKTGAV